MKFKPAILASLLAASFMVPSIHAETIEISVSKQAPELQSIARPENGMSKNQVEAKFGPPQAMSEPVGQPPISAWTYDKFTVYFEYDTVLHSVLRTQSATTGK